MHKDNFTYLRMLFQLKLDWKMRIDDEVRILKEMITPSFKVPFAIDRGKCKDKVPVLN